MTVLINDRSAVHKSSNGTLTTQDICKTGADQTPVAYNNIAKSADVTNCAQTVFINNNPMAHKKSYFCKSQGDEAGDGGGVQSNTTQEKAEFLTASANVFTEGNAAVRQGDLMVSNKRNTPPAQLQQP